MTTEEHLDALIPRGFVWEVEVERGDVLKVLRRDANLLLRLSDCRMLNRFSSNHFATSAVPPSRAEAALLHREEDAFSVEEIAERCNPLGLAEELARASNRTDLVLP
jgi:hypothetical protein